VPEQDLVDYSGIDLASLDSSGDGCAPELDGSHRG
jgi:hypothetical protein